MALPENGPLSFLDIQGEFGGNFPISMTEYYGEDDLPNSGTISVQDFRGQSSQFDISQSFPTSKSSFNDNEGQAITRITFSSGGTVVVTATAGNTSSTNWINPTSDAGESNFQVFAERTNTFRTFGTYGQYLNISTNPSFGIQSNNGEGQRISDLTFKIRDGNDTTNLTPERTIRVIAESTNNN